MVTRADPQALMDSKVMSQYPKLNIASPTAVASAAAPAFANLGSPSQSDIFLQAALKVSSEIDTLVELGKTGGTPQITKEKIKLHIAQKIQALMESVKDPYNIPSVRSDLCKLTRISSTHYSELKEKAFDLLIKLIEEDPVAPHTANGVLEIVIELNSDLILSKAQLLTINFQKKLARTFSAAVELYLRHYNKEDHVNAVTESQKKDLLETQKSFNGLNTKENVALEFASQMAIEAGKRLTSDSSAFMEVLERLSHFAFSLGKAYANDLSGFFTEFVQVFQGLDNKIKEKWFEGLFMMRDLALKAPDDIKKVVVIQSIFATKKVIHDWKFIYGALEILTELISKTDDVKVLELALCGQTLKMDTAAVEALEKQIVTLSKTVAEATAPRFPGAVDFIAYKEFSRKAFIATGNDKKADTNIQNKAKELSASLAKKLATTFDGRQLLLDRYLAVESPSNETEKNLLLILKVVIPADQKMRTTWLGSKSEVDSKHDLAITSPSSAKKPPLPLPKTPPHPLPKQTTVSKQVPLTGEKVAENKLFLQRSNNGNEKQIRPATPPLPPTPKLDFHQSVAQGKTAAVQAFLEQNKELASTKDANGNSPLMLAARIGAIEVCTMLTKAGASPITRGEKFQNALHNAAAAGHVEIVKLFSSEKMLLDAVDEDNNTPLMLAVKNGHANVCAFLLDAKPNIDGLNLLHIAAANGQVAVVDLLIKRKLISINAKDRDGNTALILAVKNNHNQACKSLLNAGANHTLVDLFDRNALHWAVRLGHIDIVNTLSPSYKDLINSRSKQGTTSLSMAASSGHVEICEILLTAGANPNIPDEKGLNSMHTAARAGKVAVIQLLSKNKPLIDSRTLEGTTPLMFAADSGNVEACKKLLQLGAKPTLKDEGGLNALHYAAQKGNLEVVKLLSAHQELVNSKIVNGQTPLIIAAQNGYREICEILLKAGAKPDDVDTEKFNAMHWAVSQGKMDVVQLLSSYKNLINSRSLTDYSPLILALTRNHLEIFQHLLNQGADPNENFSKYPVLFLAVYLDNLIACNMLLKKNANPLAMDIDGNNVLHLAETIEIVRLFLPYKNLINSKNKLGNTPFMLVENEEIFDALLKAGANLNEVNKDNWIVMHYAANNGRAQIVRKLLTLNPKFIHSRTKDGNTPLMLAASKGHLESSKILLEAGASPHDTGHYDFNTLHHAAFNGKAEIVRLLSDDKILINSKRKGDDNTPLFLAAEKGHREVCEVLLKAGADTSITTVEGWNVLLDAIFNGKKEMVELFSTDQRILDLPNIHGQTCLEFAATEKKIDIWEILLKAGAKARLEFKEYYENFKALTNAKGNTPLLIAAENGNYQMCELLLKAGANLNATNEEGFNAMHMAIQAKKLNIVKYLSIHKTLLEAKTNSGHTPFLLAVQQNQKEAVEVLLKAGVDPEATLGETGQNALHMAIVFNHIEMIQQLSTNKKLITSKPKAPFTPLMEAVRHARSQAFEILLKAGADPEEIPANKDQNVLHMVVLNNNLELVRLLISNKKLLEALTKSGLTPLLLAASKGHKDLVAMLLKEGANWAAVDNDGNNALHLAVISDKGDVVKLLASNRKLIDAKNNDGFTPLMLAANLNFEILPDLIHMDDDNKRMLAIRGLLEKEEIAEILLKMGANAEEIDKEGNNALHLTLLKVSRLLDLNIIRKENIATSKPLLLKFSKLLDDILIHRYVKVIKCFATNKKILDSKTQKGLTPLMLTSEVRIVEELMQAGANTEATNEDGENALQIAKAKGNKEIVELFEKQKQKDNAKK